MRSLSTLLLIACLITAGCAQRRTNETGGSASYSPPPAPSRAATAARAPSPTALGGGSSTAMAGHRSSSVDRAAGADFQATGLNTRGFDDTAGRSALAPAVKDIYQKPANLGKLVSPPSAPTPDLTATGRRDYAGSLPSFATRSTNSYVTDTIGTPAGAPPALPESRRTVRTAAANSAKGFTPGEIGNDDRLETVELPDAQDNTLHAAPAARTGLPPAYASHTPTPAYASSTVDSLSMKMTHTIEPGDTLSSIARRHGVSLAALLEANPQISDPNQIQVGMNLKIPAVR